VDDRHRAGGDQIAQELPRSHQRQLIHVADEDDRAGLMHRLQELVGERHVDHRTLVGNEQIAFQG
jgi:hypothetical protein